ncbi:EAL domain-containing protein [Deinococcus radiopugnans ATCC 19172]|uniref:EAL domain-containing protein n=1 Tax=Deinococcus radiopugnans ATCC 19172 TaxID=585398 RepID=A0A5C4XYP7_9DEIO|nr:EAL domain-containing protein [Deinococcus radiopugnans ATCC 19172]
MGTNVQGMSLSGATSRSAGWCPGQPAVKRGGEPTTGQALRVSLLATLLLALAHLGWAALHPGGQGRLLQTCSLGVLYASALTCWFAARVTPETALTWRWMAWALGIYAVSNTVYVLLEQRNGAVPFPSVLDAFYLGFYGLFSAACLALPRRPLRQAEAWRLTLDVGIVAGALGVLLWYGALASRLGTAQTTLIGSLVSLAYPGAGLSALGLLLLVIRRRERFQLEESLLALGLIIFVIADTLYLFLGDHGGFASGLPVDLLWTAGATLFALAAWHSPRAVPLGRPLTAVIRAAPRFTRPLYTLAPYLGLIVCFAMALLTHGEDTLAARGVLWGTAGVTLLVAARQLAALTDNAALTAQLAALNATLESRVTARTAEVERGRAQLEAHALELAWQAHHDSLTGLPNRAGFLTALGEAVERQQAPAEAGLPADLLAVLFLDLDGFKGINDTLGHTVGDQLLIKVAARLRGAQQPGEFTARLGGDEFMVLTSQPPQARARQVLELFTAPFDLSGRPVRISASVGVSVYPDSGQDAESLYMHADVAMYEAKRAGKDAARVFQPQMAGQRSQTPPEERLRGALERGEFSLFYQPICNAARQTVTLEALLRWHSPELGLLAPGQFLPAAQRLGLEDRLGDWVLNEACAQLARWHAAGHADLRVAVNISRSQLERPDLPGQVGTALARHRLSGSCVEFELAAPLPVGAEGQAIPVMRAVQEQGVRWSLCGFGAAQSALTPLLRLPVQTLKLDRGLIGALDGPPDGQAQARRAVQASVALAGALGLSVVAEGVETHAQWAAATALGCDLGQGFWLGHPQNTAKTTARLGHALEQPHPPG